MKEPTKAEIIERAKNITEYKQKQEQIIAGATELYFIDRMLALNSDQISNTRMALKRLMKEGQLLRNIKKKWKS